MDTGASLPPATLLQMMTGYWVSQALHAAAKLGIADQLTERPVDCEDLAAATNSHAPSLQRVLRALASVGVFTEVSPGSFALTQLAELLRTETPGSMRALAIMYAEEQYRAWGDLLHSVRTGETAFDKQFGMGYFEYLAQHPEADRVFNEAMTGWTRQLVGAVVDTYDFSPFKTVVDVGGGYGAAFCKFAKNVSNLAHWVMRPAKRRGIMCSEDLQREKGLATRIKRQTKAHRRGGGSMSRFPSLM